MEVRLGEELTDYFYDQQGTTSSLDADRKRLQKADYCQIGRNWKTSMFFKVLSIVAKRQTAGVLCLGSFKWIIWNIIISSVIILYIDLHTDEVGWTRFLRRNSRSSVKLKLDQSRRGPVISNKARDAK
jgi:hypothetical protein